MATDLALRDLLGKRGELLFADLIMTPDEERGILFNPAFLGDKWPTADFLVELVGADATAPFFFVQVRSTMQPLTLKEKRLPIAISAAEISALAMCPAPTYLVGIDIALRQGYIVSVNGELSASPLSSICTTYPLNAENLIRLWDEVRAFWNSGLNGPKLASAFVESRWKG